MYPKITLIIVNYNSSKIMDIVRESVSGACNLDYPNFEVIVVDNGSTDGSGEQIRKYLESKCKIKNKYIKLSKNLGFNAANNIAFRARDKDSKYVALLNNDATPYPDSLARLVEHLESEEELAAIQGIITNWDASSIDNVGFIVDELLYSHAVYRGYPPHVVKKSHYCTYVSGAYSLYSIKSLITVNKGERIFDDIMFAYYDDKILGMKLWSNGYKVGAIPVLAARHYGGGTFGKISPTRLYLISRSFLAQERILVNHRYKLISLISHIIRQFAYTFIASKTTGISLKKYTRSYISALMHGWKLASYLDYKIDISKVPLIRLGLGEVLVRMAALGHSNRFGRVA